jgi:hypothetical protein
MINEETPVIMDRVLQVTILKPVKVVVEDQLKNLHQTAKNNAYNTHTNGERKCGRITTY